MNNTVTINLHGHLGQAIGKQWKLAVRSVREAIYAINSLTHNKLYKYFLRKDMESAKYSFKLNNRFIEKGREAITLKNSEELLKTEYAMESDDLFSIDIIPVIEGADKNVLGGILIVLGVILIMVGGIGIMAGLTLIMGGISMLLSKSPKFEPFPNIKQEGIKSYFFGGSVNIISEGGPVPLGYGEAMIGSQVISLGFNIAVRTDTVKHEWPLPNRFYPIT